jgi:hypothetical protein
LANGKPGNGKLVNGKHANGRLTDGKPESPLIGAPEVVADVAQSPDRVAA